MTLSPRVVPINSSTRRGDQAKSSADLFSHFCLALFRFITFHSSLFLKISLEDRGLHHVPISQSEEAAGSQKPEPGELFHVLFLQLSRSNSRFPNRFALTLSSLISTLDKYIFSCPAFRDQFRLAARKPARSWRRRRYEAWISLQKEVVVLVGYI